jgi:hypothetical protein
VWFPWFVHAYMKHINLTVPSVAHSITDRMVKRVASMEQMRQENIVDLFEILLRYFWTAWEKPRCFLDRIADLSGIKPSNSQISTRLLIIYRKSFDFSAERSEFPSTVIVYWQQNHLRYIRVRSTYFLTPLSYVKPSSSSHLSVKKKKNS